MPHKPFNLQAALNGAKLVTRNGREAKQFTFFECQDTYPCIAVIGDTKCAFTRDGQHLDDMSPSHELDLFLAPQTREGWINIYYDGEWEKNTCSEVYSSKEFANLGANSSTRIACIKIEWEE